MKALFVLIVLAAGGYFGYNFYLQREGGSEGDDGSPSSQAASRTPGRIAPAPFKSRIDAPEAAAGEKRVAPPGVFYMLDRVSVETSNGVLAVVPGDKVKLLQRKPDRLKLTTGTFDFEAPATKVTNDIDLALEAERKEAIRLNQLH